MEMSPGGRMSYSGLLNNVVNDGCCSSGIGHTDVICLGYKVTSETVGSEWRFCFRTRLQ